MSSQVVTDAAATSSGPGSQLVFGGQGMTIFILPIVPGPGQEKWQGGGKSITYALLPAAPP